MKKLFLLTSILFFCFLFIQAENTISDTLHHKESFFERIMDKYIGALNHYTVAGLMIVESSCFIPFPSEIVVPPAAYGACNPENSALYVTDYKFLNILLVILFATIGALIGAIINYFLAFYLGRPIVYWFVETRVGHFCLLNKQKIIKAENYFVKNGNISTFICRLIPGVRQVISVPAGLAKMKFLPFVLYTTLGAGLWNVILAILGYIAHGQQNIINKFAHEISIVLLALGILFVGYLFYRAFAKKKQPQDTQN